MSCVDPLTALPLSRAEADVVLEEIDRIIRIQGRFKPDASQIDRDRLETLARAILSEPSAGRLGPENLDVARTFVGALRGRYDWLESLQYGGQTLDGFDRVLSAGTTSLSLVTRAMTRVLRATLPRSWWTGRGLVRPLHRWGEIVGACLIQPTSPCPARDRKAINWSSVSVVDATEGLYRSMYKEDLHDAVLECDVVGGCPGMMVLLRGRRFLAWYPSGVHYLLPMGEALHSTSIDLSPHGLQILGRYVVELERAEQHMLRSEVNQELAARPDLEPVHLLCANLHLVMLYSGCLVWRSDASGLRLCGLSAYSPHELFADEWKLKWSFWGMGYSENLRDDSVGWRNDVRDFFKARIVPLPMPEEPHVTVGVGDAETIRQIEGMVGQNGDLGRWRLSAAGASLWAPLGHGYCVQLLVPTMMEQLEPHAEAMFRFLYSTHDEIEALKMTALSNRLVDLGKQYRHAIQGPAAAASVLMFQLGRTLERSPAITASELRSFQNAFRSVRHLDSISESLGWFFRFQDGARASRLSRIEFDAADVLGDTLENLQVELREPLVQFRAQIEPARTVGARELLLLACDLAIRNAADAAVDAGLPYVDVECTRTGSTVRIAIENPAPSLSDAVFREMKRSLTQGVPFPTSKPKGFGIGLNNIGECLKDLEGSANLSHQEGRIRIEFLLKGI